MYRQLRMTVEIQVDAPGDDLVQPLIAMAMANQSCGDQTLGREDVVRRNGYEARVKLIAFQQHYVDADGHIIPEEPAL
jgi:hypothetical protein